MTKPEQQGQRRWGSFDDSRDRFSPEVVAAETRRLPTSVPLIFAVMLTLLAAAILWSVLARLDRVVETEATLVSRNPRQLIRPHTASVLADMPVRVGSVFRTGDVLVQFDPTLSAAEYDRLANLVAALRLEHERLTVEATIDAPMVPKIELPAGTSWVGSQQEGIFRMRLLEWRSRITADAIRTSDLEQDRQTLTTRATLLSRQIERIEAELVTKRRGVDDGFVKKDQVFELEVRLMSLQGELLKLDGDLARTASQIQLIAAEQQGYFATLRRNASERLEEVSRKLAENEEQLLKAAYLGTRDKIVASFDGVVLDAMERAPGTVVHPGDVLLIATRFTDETDLEVEATIRPMDVGWIREGMPARIKLAALPSGKYGYLAAEVVSISADALQGDRQIRDSAPRRSGSPGDVGHRALLRITDKKLKSLPENFALSPGMVASAEIVIGERRPYEYFLEPILDGASRALTERN